MKDKRSTELDIMEEMIAIYCKAKHGSEDYKNCPECSVVREYSASKIERCPRMQEKSFCSSCQRPCYSPDMRVKIKEIMRFSGPKLLFRHPFLVISHIVDSIKNRKR